MTSNSTPFGRHQSTACQDAPAQSVIPVSGLCVAWMAGLYSTDAERPEQHWLELFQYRCCMIGKSMEMILGDTSCILN